MPTDPPQLSPSLLWFRDDLRVDDHEALVAARADGPVVALWIREERDADGLGPRPLGAASRWWAHESLAVLEAELDRLGIPLLLAAGQAAGIVPAVAREIGTGAAHWSRRYAPRSRALDRSIKASLLDFGVDAHSHSGALLVEPWTLAPASGPHYKVFTPFWKAASSVPVAAPLPAVEPQILEPELTEKIAGLPGRVPGLVTNLNALGLRKGPVDWWDTTIARHWTPGCRAAADRLAKLDDAITGYSEARDRPADPHGTSALSPRLRFGELSPRQLLTEVAAMSGVDSSSRTAWVRQLYWREFAWHLCFHIPDLDRIPMRPEFARFPYDGDPNDLEAWRHGTTGVPLVDAGMHQLWETGWMHNRVRMVTASFLTKNLLHPWQSGEQWFWDTLVDADEANNPVSWQWVAGCGADASPFFRIFNPERQRERFDPDGSYVSRWTDRDRPPPIVDLGESRVRALEAFETMKRS